MCNEVLGSRLPLGFMNELQVRLATQTNLPTGSKSREVFVTCEAALVDRIAGSVLTMPYKSGGGKTREWVILSGPSDVRTQCQDPVMQDLWRVGARPSPPASEVPEACLLLAQR